MIISKELLNKLAEEGIVIRPCLKPMNEELESYKQSWLSQRPLEDYRKYKGAKTDEEALQMRENDMESALKWHERYMWEQGELFIFVDDIMIHRKSVGVYKHIEEDYIRSLIEREKKKYKGYFGSFALTMTKLLRKELGQDYIGVNIYPTTYGIGVWSIYNWNFENDVQTVKALMDKYGIKYANEFSDKEWVYRFKVDKSACQLVIA